MKDRVCDVDGVTHRHAALNGVRLHWVEQGRGPAVLLLHGFPDFWYGWRHQIGYLAARGFRVIAPDLRGYNESERPQGVHRYTLRDLQGDVVALIRMIDAPVAGVVGHDWGGVIAWRIGMLEPALTRRLVILNAPHPAVYRRSLLRSTQLARSWYAGFFQLPWLPETVLRAFGLRAIERALREQQRGRPVISDDELACYRRVFEPPGALTGPLNYYRAAGRDLLAAAVRPGSGANVRGGEHVDIPTLVVHGERDRYLSPRLLDGLDRHVTAVSIIRIKEAGHFVHWHEPGRVNHLIGEFLRT